MKSGSKHYSRLIKQTEANNEPAAKRQRQRSPERDMDDGHWLSRAKGHTPLWQSFQNKKLGGAYAFDEWLQSKVIAEIIGLKYLALGKRPGQRQAPSAPAWARPEEPIDWPALTEFDDATYEAYVDAVIDAGGDGLQFDITDATVHPRIAAAYQALARHFPLHPMPAPRSPLMQDTETAIRAFQREEAPCDDGMLASACLLRTISELRAEYYDSPGRYMAPYTTLIGPSGMGKSYAVQQLARLHGHFVVYTCLPSPGTAPIPAHTPGVHLHSLQTLASAETFWTRFLNVGLALVDAAVSRSISAGDLFAMQIDQHRNSDLCMRLWGLYNSQHSGDDISAALDDTLAHSTSPSKAHAVDARVRPDTPVIFCFDEARALFGGNSSIPEPPLLLRGLRHALRQKRNPRVFALMLDTSSRVASFLPPATRDPSQKVPIPVDLLPPITALPTWDVVVRQLPLAQSWIQDALSSSSKQHANIILQRGPDGSTGYQVFLYSLGRPLWGAMIAAAADMPTGVDLARSLARSKMRGSRKERDSHLELEQSLALLSYRFQFSVSDQAVAKQLVAQWLHFPVRVSEDREFMEIVQPSEPILAATAASLLRIGETWSTAIQQFCDFYTRGAQTRGDAGEMVACILLLLSADSVPRPDRYDAWPDVVSVSAFFKALLLTPADAAAGPAADVRGLVHLTHIGRFYSDGPVTGSHLQHAFLTGQGLLLRENAMGADLVIPVWDAESKDMGAVLVQVKNRARAAHVRPGTRAAAQQNFYSAREELPPLADDLVYGLFLDLRQDTSEVQWLPRRNARDIPIAVVTGCDATVYAALANHARGDQITTSLHTMLRGGLPHGNANLPTATKALLFTRDGKTSVIETED